MGVVFRARDTTLDRDVALKFLTEGIADTEEARERFIREARAAAALEHPNICGVYEIDQVDGHTFISMPIVEGESLSDVLSRGPLPIREAVRIVSEIGRALGGHQRARGDGQILVVRIRRSVGRPAVVPDHAQHRLAVGGEAGQHPLLP